MMPLGTHAARVGDPLRPGDDQAVARAAVVAGDLLGPLKRRAHRVRPADGIVVVGLPGADVIDALEHRGEILLDAIEECHLVEEPLRAPLGAGAIVADDIEDEGVVELAGGFDRLDHPAGVVVGLLEESGIHLHHPGVDLLLIGREARPGGDAGGEGDELRVGRHDAELFLAGERFRADRIPAGVELTGVFLDPFLAGVVRGVGGARRVVEEEGLLRGDGLLGADPLHGPVGEIVVEVIVRIFEIGLDRLRPLDRRRPPLVGVAADEAEEVLEAEAGRPEIERPGLARLPIGDVVVLAKPGGAPGIELENLGDRRRVLLHDGVVAGEAGGRFGDRSRVDGVMVAAGDQGGAGGAAQGRGVKLRVAEAAFGEQFEDRRLAGAAKGARGSEADVIEEDEEDVRRAFGRLNRLREIGGGILGTEIDRAAKRCRGGRKDLGGRSARFGSGAAGGEAAKEHDKPQRTADQQGQGMVRHRRLLRGIFSVCKRGRFSVSREGAEKSLPNPCLHNGRFNRYS